MNIPTKKLIMVLESKITDIDNKSISLDINEIECLRIDTINEVDKITSDYYKELKELKTLEGLLSQIKSKMI